MPQASDQRVIAEIIGLLDQNDNTMVSKDKKQ